MGLPGLDGVHILSVLRPYRGPGSVPVLMEWPLLMLAFHGIDEVQEDSTWACCGYRASSCRLSLFATQKNKQKTWNMLVYILLVFIDVYFLWMGLVSHSLTIFSMSANTHPYTCATSSAGPLVRGI